MELLVLVKVEQSVEYAFLLGKAFVFLECSNSVLILENMCHLLLMTSSNLTWSIETQRDRQRSMMLCWNCLHPC